MSGNVDRDSVDHSYHIFTNSEQDSHQQALSMLCLFEELQYHINVCTKSTITAGLGATGGQRSTRDGLHTPGGHTLNVRGLINETIQLLLFRFGQCYVISFLGSHVHVHVHVK